MGGKKGGKQKGRGKGSAAGAQAGSSAAAVAPELVVLHGLAKEGKLAEMQAHGMSGINLLYNDQHSRTPLHLAAYYGHLEVVDAILTVCPDACNRQAQDGFLPAHFAAQQGHLECLRRLVREQTTNEEGETRVGAVRRLMGRLVKGEKNMLHLACGKQHVDTALYLVDKGCDLFAKASNGKTAFELLEPAHVAAVKAKLESIEDKMKHKAGDKEQKAGVPQTSDKAAAASAPKGKSEPPSSPSGGLTLKREKRKAEDAVTEDDMEAKLAAMMAGAAGDLAPAVAPAPKEEEAAAPAAAKKAKFSLDEVLQNSYT